MRSARRLRATKARKSRVDRSAQCRSSNTIRTGARSSASRPSRYSTSSHSRRWPWRLENRRRSDRARRICGRRAASSPRASCVELLKRIVDPRLRHVAQRCDDRRVRELLAAELHALAVESEEPALARARLELTREAGLAHAGLAGDQHEPRMPASRRCEHIVKQAKGLVAPDNRLAGNPTQSARTISPHADGHHSDIQRR